MGGLRSIREVVALLADEFPDVTPSSLRFFELEGLVLPRRTPGGHRLYGDQEIERLRRIRRWQREERLSLAAVRERLAAADRLPAPSALGKLFLKEALAGRPDAARAAVVGAHAAGVPLGVLFRQVLGPVLEEVGDRWAAGRLAVSQEHEVSAIVRDVVAELAARAGARTAGSASRPAEVAEEARAGKLGAAGSAARRGAQTGRVVVAACPPGERHDLGLRMVAAELQALGHTVHFLGADVPVEALVQAVRARRPAAVLLSATREEHLPALEEAVRALAAPRASGSVGGRDGTARVERGRRLDARVLVGGQAATLHAERLRELGAEVLDGEAQLEDLLGEAESGGFCCG